MPLQCHRRPAAPGAPETGSEMVVDAWWIYSFPVVNGMVNDGE